MRATDGRRGVRPSPAFGTNQALPPYPSRSDSGCTSPEDTSNIRPAIHLSNCEDDGSSPPPADSLSSGSRRPPPSSSTPPIWRSSENSYGIPRCRPACRPSSSVREGRESDSHGLRRQGDGRRWPPGSRGTASPRDHRACGPAGHARTYTGPADRAVPPPSPARTRAKRPKEGRTST